MKALFITLGLLGLPLATQAAEASLKPLTLPSGQVLTIAQGRGEPASTGSYDVRLYSGANPKFPFDQFIDGKVMARNGTIKALKLQDLDGDKQPELVVIMESAGSGGYLSADAFTVTPKEGLDSFNHVEGLAPTDDVIQALKTPRD